MSRFPMLEQIANDLKMELPTMKPCPFCGSELLDLEGHQIVNVTCFKCYAEGPTTRQGEHPYAAVRLAVALWNKRAGEP